MDAVRPQKMRHRNLTAWLICVALLPFGISLGFHVAGQRARAAARGDMRPALVFDQYLVNLREALPSATVQAHFSFVHRGEQPAEITELDASCGCLKPRLEKRVYQPGERGRFVLRVETTGEKPGPKEYRVTMRYQDPQPRETVLTFKVVLPKLEVTVAPKALLVYQFAAGETTRDIYVTDHADRGLSLTSAECKSPLVDANIAGMEIGADGQRRHRVRVHISKEVPQGRHRTFVAITTNDQKYRFLRVPLWIERSTLPAKSPARTAGRQR